MPKSIAWDGTSVSLSLPAGRQVSFYTVTVSRKLSSFKTQYF